MAGDSRIAEETLSRVLPVPVPTRSTASWNSGKSIEELDPKPIKKPAHAHPQGLPDRGGVPAEAMGMKLLVKLNW